MAKGCVAEGGVAEGWVAEGGVAEGGVAEGGAGWVTVAVAVTVGRSPAAPDPPHAVSSPSASPVTTNPRITLYQYPITPRATSTATSDRR